MASNTFFGIGQAPTSQMNTQSQISQARFDDDMDDLADYEVKMVDTSMNNQQTFSSPFTSTQPTFNTPMFPSGSGGSSFASFGASNPASSFGFPRSVMTQNAPASNIFLAPASAQTPSVFSAPATTQHAPVSNMFSASPSVQKAPTPSMFSAPTAAQSAPVSSMFSAPTSTQNAPTPNPFAATITQTAPTANPFLAPVVANSGPGFSPFTSRAAGDTPTDNASFPRNMATEMKVTSNHASSRSDVPTSNPFSKPKGPENKPPLDATDKSASRQTRFDGATDIGDLYRQEQQKREKERVRLINAGIIDDPEVQKPLDQAITFSGTCTNMCPRFECIQRSYQQMVDSFEQTNGKPDFNRFVKSFHRPAAGMENPLPSDVRTPQTLVETLRYLLYDIMGEYQWQDCHGFVRDRTRSIRQDFTFQNYEGDELVKCVEIIARFHIVGLYMMATNPDHQEYMELEQLDKCLTTLGHVYDDRADTAGRPKVYPNEAEFRAYTILRHLWDGGVERDGIERWPVNVRNSPQLKHALNIYCVVQSYNRSMQSGINSQNYVKTFFALVKAKETDFTTFCLLQLQFSVVRRHSLEIMAKNYMKTSRMTTVKFIKEYLLYETVEKAVEDIQHYGMEVAEQTADGVSNLYLIPGKYFAEEATKRRTELHPSLAAPKLNDEKPLAEMMWGPELGSQPRTEMNGPSKPQPDALIRGECQSCEVDFDSEADSFFNFPGASVGDRYYDQNDTEVGNSVTEKQQSVFPKASFSAQSVFGEKQRSMFPMDKTGKISDTFVSPFASTPQSVFSNADSSSAKIPPTFSGPSILNPFAQPASKFNAIPVAAQPPEINDAENSHTTPSMHGGLARNTSRLQAPQRGSAKESPLFLGTEDDLSDDDEGDTPAPATASWTSFLPSEVGITSSKPGAVSIFDRITTPTTGFQFGNAQPVPPAATAFFQAPPPTKVAPTFKPTPIFSAPLFAPFSSANATGVVNSTQAEPLEPSTIATTKEMTLGQIDQTNDVLVREKREREDTIAREKREREEAIAQAARKQGEEIALVAREREEEIARIAREREEAISRKLREKEETAQSFYNRHLKEKIFYFYLGQARRKKRRSDRRKREQHRTAFAEDPQWWPIIKDGSLYKEPVQKVSELVFKSAELEKSIPDIVHMALEKSGISNTTYRMLLYNNDNNYSGQSAYWFQQKFLGTQKEIIVPGHSNQFCAQSYVFSDEAEEVGLLVFGCSSDFSLSSEERFGTDRRNLHIIVKHIAEATKFQKLAVMVICYRSPIDTEPADPSGLDDTRTLGSARRLRVQLVKDALGFSGFGDKVIGKTVIMVETLRDLDLSHELQKFAQDYILETVNKCYSVSPHQSTEARDDSPARSNKSQKTNRKELENRPRRKSEAISRAQPAKSQVGTALASPKMTVSVATPTNGVKGKKRVGESSPKTPRPYNKSPSSSTKRRRDGDTPMKRYCRRKQEEERFDTAQLKAKTLMDLHEGLHGGFQVVLQSQTKPPSPPPPRPSPRRPDTTKLENSISDLDKQIAEWHKFAAENTLETSFL